MDCSVAIRVALDRPNLVTHVVLAATSVEIDRGRLWLLACRSADPDYHPDSSWGAVRQPSIDEPLSAVTIPTLRIWATNDPISPLANDKRLNNLLSDSRFVTYELGSNWIVLDHETDVNSEIDAFLRATKQ
jgi:pimeloyl-ACP methyl ester carboxylesterase